MKANLRLLTVLACSLAAFSCTKGKQEVPVGPDGKPMVSKETDPEQMVFEAEVDVPGDLAKKIKRTDLLIWNLRDQNGVLLTGGITPVPKFPHKISVRAKSLVQDVPQSASLIFNARIVKFGEEHLPPKKGQLHAILGAGTPPSQPDVVNPNVDQKRLEKWQKKMNIMPAQSLTVGASVKAKFGPIIF